MREAEGDALFVGGRIHHDEGAVLGPLFADGRVKARVGVPAAVPKVDLSFLGRTSPVVAPGGIKPEPAVARLHELQERFLHDAARAGRHIGTEIRPRLLREAAVGNFAQWTQV